MKSKPKYADFNIQYVYEAFYDVFSKYVKKKTSINLLFEDVLKKYSTKSRHYHNMQHLYGMVSMWESHKHLLENPNEVFFAIMYHDIIYNVKRADNEGKSALFFNEKIAPLLKMNYESINFVVKAIVATTHSTAAVTISSLDKDIQYLLDFDLEVLGTRHQSTYDWYREGVRKEYKIYPDDIYKEGRKKVLESFLSKKNIYLTKEFKKIEKNARKNLQNEIKLYLC